ncbi:hypothetical protein Pst134EA_013676 [Puccinia striiformis f. sp. tritici]|nr:hypothetical protein Pst134EA_013676 [Puccinia striiformis f. sp. tritici]KAH9465812.1 hypothetical protein Pst134EA_013676 [Puccinia striiformis f. sp. tritici]
MSTQQQSQTLTDPPLDSSSSTPTVINRIGQLKHHLNQSSDSSHQTKNMAAPKGDIGLIGLA